MTASKPATRTELKDYCLRQLGSPVLEINVDNQQLEDRIDEALQYFQDHHYDGMERTYLKHKLTAADVTRFQDTNVSYSTTDPDTATWETRKNFIELPDNVIGIQKVFGVSSNFVRNNLFGLSNQYYLMDLFSISSGGAFSYGNMDLTNYYMIRQYFETVDMVLNTGSFVEYRYNKRQDRLYIDIDVKRIHEDSYLVLDCSVVLDPDTFTGVYNDDFLKKYTTALFKRQWGQNLIKFNNVQLPGGVSLNGRQIYEDAIKEISDIEAKMLTEYSLPPLDMIG
jgi:hypothetical protein